MSAQISEQARTDFQRARFEAFINRVWGILSGQPSTLLSYDEIKEKLHIGGPIYRGVKTVRVDQIAGSLNRYHEFDRVFLPASDKLAARWQRVSSAFQVYFVVDGHHRVSVAREQGQLYIEAEVRECACRCKCCEKALVRRHSISNCLAIRGKSPGAHLPRVQVPGSAGVALQRALAMI